jgi:hypothetical protein
MNFKRYHVSKNLFDGSIEKGSLNESLAIGTDYNDTKASPTAAINSYRVRIANPIYIDRELTLSIDFNNYQMYVLFYDENQQYTGEHSSSWRNSSLTLSGEYIGKYIGLAVKSNQGGNVPISPADDIKLMLNTGSSPLPYEPYSLEVWHDIPHYIYKTATDTLTLPAVIYPNDTSITVGIKGNTTQNGTPTPDNPIMPQGTGERTGNLFDKTNILSGYEIVNNQIVPNSAWGVSDYILVEQGKYYIATNIGAAVLEYETIGGTAVRSGKTIISGNYTPSATTRFIRINFKLVNLDNIMLNTGSTALPYEPFGVKIPILSGGTTPVYLGEVQTTRQIKKLVLDGTENWLMNADGWFYLTSVSDDYLRSEGNITSMCSHYPTYKQASAIAQLPEGYTGFSWGSVQRLYLKDTSHRNDLSSFKQWVAAQYAAGTPVTIWYVLATEETAVVNEPLMKIGSYSDSLTTSIPCTAGENTLDVQTTVAPSEVTANYRGWHPVSGVHEYDSNYTIATMQALTIAQLQTHTISDLQGGEWS